MIDKKDAKANGYEMKESNDHINKKKQQKLDQLRTLIPALIDSDDTVNINAIKDFIGTENTTSNNKGYELTFAGKGLAKAMAGIKTTKELKVEETQSKNFNETKNIIIRGDNLDALKLLHQNYHGKIKVIYIDPPYNTESDAFVYADNFKQSTEDLIENLGLPEEMLNFLNNMYGTQTHSGWLSFMYPRLELAKDLLTDDGLIFISINDKEQVNLKIICDEIFGEYNFIANMVWHSNKNIMKGSSYIRRDHEYILCYRKSKDLEKIRLKNKQLNFQNRDNDPKGDWLDTNATYTSGGHKFGIKLPTGKICYRNWRFTEEQYKKKQISLFFKGDNIPRLKIYEKDYNISNKVASSLLLKEGSTTTGKNKMSTLFKCDANNIPFDNPKDPDLIKHLLQFADHKEDIILDFFAGSGTTAEAVMELNKEDGGNRKFILIQWDEKINASRPAYDVCEKNNLEPVISSICIERVNRAGEKIKKESRELDASLDIGYKVFSLTDRPRLTGDKEILNTSRATTKDTLYNMISASGGTLLTDPIEEIEFNLLYKINHTYFVLGECKTDLKGAGRIFIDGYANISLNNWFNMLGLDKDNVKIIY